MSTVIEDIEETMPAPNPPLSDLQLRVNLLEAQLKQVQDQLKNYVPLRENELQLQNIQSTVSRIERDVLDIKTRLATQEEESRKRDDQQRDAQARLQIRALWTMVSAAAAIAGIILTGYVTHVLK